MRFAHIADCHIGAWRDSKMRELNFLQFKLSIEKILEEHKKSKISFAIIAGDLFNTSVPSIEALKLVTEQLKRLKDNKIEVIGVAGSHDYSSTGKTMLEVLEKADLFYDLMKADIENKKLFLKFKNIDGIKITGISGKKGSLEKKFYNSLDYDSLDKISKPKIFVFHSAIEEFKPEEFASMEATPLALLPKNFNYYAGGHIHYRFVKETLEGTICFPGPTCPNNFKEWEDLESGSIAIVNLENDKIKVNIEKIEALKTKSIKLNISNLNPESIEEKIKSNLIDIDNKLILLRLEGELVNTKLSDIKFNEINKLAEKKGAYHILRNTSKINSNKIELKEFKSKEINEIEDEIIQELLKDSKLKNLNKQDIEINEQSKFIKEIMNKLSNEKIEGETNLDFEERIEKEFDALIKRFEE